MTHQLGITPPQYYRQNKEWQSFVGKTATVLAVTYVAVGRAAVSEDHPYWLVFVSFEDKKRQLLVATDESNNWKQTSQTTAIDSPHPQNQLALVAPFSPGSMVKCVLRRFGTNETGLIRYGIKVEPISSMTVEDTNWDDNSHDIQNKKMQKS